MILTGLNCAFEFMKHDLSLVPEKKPALYVFARYDGISGISMKMTFKILYIGECLDLKKRTYQHFYQKSEQYTCAKTLGMNSFFIKYITFPDYLANEDSDKKEAYLKVLEAELICSYRPPCNQLLA